MKAYYEKVLAAKWGMTPSLVKVTAFLFVGLLLLPLLLQDSDKLHRFFGNYIASRGNSGSGSFILSRASQTNETLPTAPSTDEILSIASQTNETLPTAPQTDEIPPTDKIPRADEIPPTDEILPAPPKTDKIPPIDEILSAPPRTDEIPPKATRTVGPILQLIEDIREAVRVAAKGSNVSLSDADRQAWDERFPCRSRVELNPLYEKRKHVPYVPVNQQWQEVLNEYAILHRVCMRAVGDLATYFSSRDESTGCKFVIAEAHFGLGNKVLHMSSLLLYAVLTQRVLLIPSSTFVPFIMCEPFPGSSWSMSDDIHRVVMANRTTREQLYGAIDDELSANRSMTIYAGQGGNEWGPDTRFWCGVEQILLSKVTWLTFDGCLHHVPKLFIVPQFRPILEALFPRRVVLTHILRTVMLPADPVWERIVQVENVHLANAERQVGVQVRFLHGERQYDTDNLPVNDHIMKCLWENGFLPEVCPPERTMSNATLTADDKFANCSSSSVIDVNPPAPVTKVLVASLFLGFHDHITDIYNGSKTLGSETVSVVQLSHGKAQGRGVDEDSQALVEMITLSFSEVLLVTPFSTFGGLAQAYGSLVPYFIEYNPSENVPCQLGVSTEPCCLGSSPVYDCRYEDTQQKFIVDFVPYMKRCMYIDVGDMYAMLMMNDD